MAQHSRRMSSQLPPGPLGSRSFRQTKLLQHLHRRRRLRRHPGSTVTNESIQKTMCKVMLVFQFMDPGYLPPFLLLLKLVLGCNFEYLNTTQLSWWDLTICLFAYLFLHTTDCSYDHVSSAYIPIPTAISYFYRCFPIVFESNRKSEESLLRVRRLVHQTKR